ncbi:hypothetical protein ABVV53_10120 [Novosphingobium sp. RD2P27]|uniref:Uncharacterized protein n=1 Tax=Novosphingobium kalidii TaxID=3230299 RepID=A0ABV2D1S1_9SPHN
MFGINLNPVSLLATAALGPLGGIASQLMTQLASSVGQQILQSLGDKLGLPQSTIDMAQGAFAGSMGDYQGAKLNLSEAVGQLGNFYGASPADQGSVENQLNNAIDDLTTNLAQSQEAKEAKATGGQSWLMALARTLGETSDKLAGEMEAMSHNLGEGENKSSQNLMFAAKSQEFSQFFSSANTVIKAIGEALASGARKS